ncbi:MAG: helix-turn-helix domain-containing protein [Ruminococcaceae bacterium]|nr:helix-turn-helix domain-containing protein [Oscillospiraceae bacterium]
MTVGERMREQRIKLNIKPKDIADKIGKSVSTYYRYETGEIEKLTISKMCEIAGILNVSPIFLLLGLSNDSDDTAPLSPDLNSQVITVFSEQLKKIRTAYDMSYSEFAAKIKKQSGINVTKKDIENWENGIQSPEILSVAAISDIFNVSPNYLLGLNNLSEIPRPVTFRVSENSGNKWLIKNVSLLIKNNSMPLEELARITDIPLNLIKAYENGTVYSADPDDVRRIAGAYNLPYMDLLYEKDTTNLLQKMLFLNAVDFKMLESYIDTLLSDKKK